MPPDVVSPFDPLRDICMSFQTWGGPGWQEHWRMDPTHVCILHRPRQHCKSPAGGRCECKCYHRQRINPPDACSKLWEWKHRILPATGTKQHCQTGPVLSMLCWWIEKSKQMSRRMKVSLLMWCTIWLWFLFLLLPKQGAELEQKDSQGWTALFHCTSTGHQQLVKFLLDNNADANVKWASSFIPKLLQRSIRQGSFIMFPSPTGSLGLVSLPWWRLLLLDMRSLFRTCLTMWVGDSRRYALCYSKTEPHHACVMIITSVLIIHRKSK